MFEAKPPKAHDAHGIGLPVSEGETLYELTWQDLVTRLNAARDLRAELALTSEVSRISAISDSGEGVEASFDADFARCLAAQAKDLTSVNPDNSGNHKGIGRIQHDTAEKATQDPRA